MIKKKIIRFIIITLISIMLLISCNFIFNNNTKYKNNQSQDTVFYCTYQESGRIKALGNLKNGKKEGPWIYYYDQEHSIKKYYINFKNDLVDGAVKLFDEIAEDIYITFYYKNGKCYYAKYYIDNVCYDSYAVFIKYNKIRQALYENNEEYVNEYDEEWDHKELGSQHQLLSLFSPSDCFGSGYDYVYDFDDDIFGDYYENGYYYEKFLLDLEQINNDIIKFYN